MEKEVLRNLNRLHIYRVGGLIPSGIPPSTLKSTYECGLQEIIYVLLYIYMSNVQLQRVGVGGQGGLSINKPSVNEMNCYLFPEALLGWRPRQLRYIEEVNQKHTPASPLSPLPALTLTERTRGGRLAPKEKEPAEDEERTKRQTSLMSSRQNT